MSVTAVPIRPLARGSVLKLWLGLLILMLAAGAMAWIGTSGQQVVTTESGLRYRVIQEGSGPTITSADLVALRYRLRLEDGTLIENSDDTGQPFVATTATVFPGLAEGLQLMQAGGRYRLWLPPGLHVRSTPPEAPFTAEDTLVFDIDVMQIAPGMAAMQQMMSRPGGPPPGEQSPDGLGPEASVPSGPDGQEP